MASVVVLRVVLVNISSSFRMDNSMMGIANGIVLDGRQNSIDRSAVPIVTFLPPRRRTSEWDSNRRKDFGVHFAHVFPSASSSTLRRKSCGGTDAYSAAWRQFAS